jgi:SAM-dependent methyltransferase
MTVDPVAARAFGAMAEEYERGRPGWPAGAIAAVLERFGARTVLDLAAGTGKLTELLAGLADDVVAVEPVDGMRRVLAARLPGVRALAGTAEAIPLPDGSVDAVLVGEAFHWFDLERAPAEIARVLRPGGGLAVMWNVPGWDSVEWLDELDAEVIEPYRREILPVHRESVPWRAALEGHGRFEPLHDETAENPLPTDRTRILALIRSFSWMSALAPDRHEAAMALAEAILERHGIDEVTLQYRTLITTARRLDG